MTRDTAVAIWYRRLDPGCFTTRRQATDADGSPSMEASYDAQTEPEMTVHATNVSDHWASLNGERPGRPIEAIADRL